MMYELETFMAAFLFSVGVVAAASVISYAYLWLTDLRRIFKNSKEL